MRSCTLAPCFAWPDRRIHSCRAATKAGFLLFFRAAIGGAASLLKILDMAENKLREEAASAFVLALTVNKDLEELELGRNAMTPSAKKGLQKRARVSSGSAQHAFRTLKL